MGDGSLSQEEIDALLMGADDSGGGDAGADPFAGMGGATAAPAAGGSALSSLEKDALTSSFNEAMGLAGGQASTLVGKSVTIENATVDEIPSGNIASEIQPGNVVVSINMGSTKTVLNYPQAIAKRIAMLMLGAETEPAELTDSELSTLSELTNTLLSSLSQNLGAKFNDNLSPDAPDVIAFSGPESLPTFSNANVTKITYTLSIEGESSGRIVHYIDSEATKQWAKNSGAGDDAGADPFAGMDTGPAPQQQAAPSGGVGFNSVSFPTLQQSSGGQSLPPNYELLLDVQMILTVELGRTNKYVKDILSLGEGSIIELDKLAGEPVDLLVNGKLIAKGEVVVIDENFGVRVTDIVGPAERLQKMSGG